MASMQSITVDVILKFDELEKLFQEWLAELPKDEVIEDAFIRFLDWLKQRASTTSEMNTRSPLSAKKEE